MIQVICDNCNAVLRDKEDNVGAQPETQCVLRLEAGGKNMLMMDLCVRCMSKYFKVLKEPV